MPPLRGRVSLPPSHRSERLRAAPRRRASELVRYPCHRERPRTVRTTRVGERATSPRRPSTLRTPTPRTAHMRPGALLPSRRRPHSLRMLRSVVGPCGSNCACSQGASATTRRPPRGCPGSPRRQLARPPHMPARRQGEPGQTDPTVPEIQDVPCARDTQEVIEGDSGSDVGLGIEHAVRERVHLVGDADIRKYPDPDSGSLQPGAPQDRHRVRPAGLGHYAPSQITLELRGRKIHPFGGLEEVLPASPGLLPCPTDALESVNRRPVGRWADRAPGHSVIAHLAMLGVRSGRRPRPGPFFRQPLPPPDALQSPADAGSGAQSSSRNAETKASWGTSTRPMLFIFFLPSFCFSRSFRLRVMSPP